jgi:hypothetical protein
MGKAMLANKMRLEELKAQIQSLPPEKQRKLAAFIATQVGAALYNTEPTTPVEREALEQQCLEALAVVDQLEQSITALAKS